MSCKLGEGEVNQFCPAITFGMERKGGWVQQLPSLIGDLRRNAKPSGETACGSFPCLRSTQGARGNISVSLNLCNMVSVPLTYFI
jgi:hypothetical protein